MKRRHREPHPLTRLSLAMTKAARNINSGDFRRIAAHDAASIPISRAEIGGGRKGQLARDGRKLLASLQTLPPDEFPDAVERLRAYADAVASRFEQVCEDTLGDRRRRA